VGEGGAYADDRVFATLVTRTREWDLGGGVIVMLSDTVGFVRDLPHHLIASFRATLEEATHADLLLIVLDVSDPAAELQFDTVVQTLDELESEVREIEEDDGNLPGSHAWGDTDGWRPPRRVLLLNKCDKLNDNRDLLVWMKKSGTSGIERVIPISAIQPPPDGTGHEELRQLVLGAARSGIAEIELTVPLKDGKAIQRLESRGQVLDRKYLDDGAHVHMRVRIGRRQLDQLRSSSPGLRITEVGAGSIG
jgi:GTPase